MEIAAVDLSNGANVIGLAKQFPEIDILINNAGAVPAGSLFMIDETSWRAGWELKVFGYINMCREYYPLIKQRGGGVIINIIGIGGLTKDPMYICGAGSNAALSAFTQALGSESHLDNIRVVGVSPGPVATERLKEMARQRGDASDSPDQFGRRNATPEEIAAVVVFAASEQASYISGTVINVDAGASKL